MKKILLIENILMFITFICSVILYFNDTLWASILFWGFLTLFSIVYFKRGKTEELKDTDNGKS